MPKPKENIKFNSKTGSYDVVMKKAKPKKPVKLMESTIGRPLTKKAERKVESGKWKKQIIKSPGADKVDVYKGSKKQLAKIGDSAGYYDFNRIAAMPPVKKTMRSKVQWYKGIDESFGHKPSKRSAYVKFIKGKKEGY